MTRMRHVLGPDRGFASYHADTHWQYCLQGKLEILMRTFARCRKNVRIIRLRGLARVTYHHRHVRATCNSNVYSSN